MKGPTILEILRPTQWYKNLVLFVPLIFSLNLFDGNLWIPLLIGFVTLCLASGAVYVINDVVDYKKDLLHPKKAKRAIPSGRISRRQAIVYAIILILVSESIANFLGLNFLIINSIFIFSTILYSVKIKNIFLVEAFIIAVNYVLRAVAGAFAIDVQVSPWLIIAVFFLSLLLTFGKRKSEILFLPDDKNIEHRPVLKSYTPDLINYAITSTSSAIILAYAIYSVNGPPGIDDWRLVLTIPVGFFILTRYVYRTLRGEYSGGELDNLLTSDKQLIGSILVYVSFAILLLYFAPSSFFR
ncbi:MAG: UbiA prenyltransferase family protein [Nitrososphaerales archaeon]